MAVKKPLVLASGQIQELQSSDEINIDASDITTGTVATARLASGTANNTTFLRGDQTWAVPAGGGGGSSPVITVFNSSGTYTNPQTGVMRIICIGAGTGGGSGRRGAAGENRFGGGAGSAAGYTVANFIASELPASLPIWVGAGGNGGAAVATNSTNGNNGSQGGSTVVGGGGAANDSNSFCFAFTAGLATGGSSVSQASSQSSTNILEGFFTTSTPSGQPPVNVDPGASPAQPRNDSAGTRGGMGGGISSANIRFNGGNSDTQVGHSFGNPVYISGGLGGSTTGSNGLNGSVVYAKRGIYLMSRGGGGGASGDTAGTIAGGTGGIGAIGSSGGGGGASTNGANSGAGGKGGDGLVVIIHWQ
jgi:hypothetical protein